MSNYYRISDPSDVRDLSEQMAAWELADNPKRHDWALVPVKPNESAQWQDGAWIVPPAPTFTPEDWTAKHFTAAQILALQRFEFALQAAGKPLGANMAGLKAWLEQMLLASADPTPRTFDAPPCSYADAAQEAVAALQS